MTCHCDGDMQAAVNPLPRPHGDGSGVYSWPGVLDDGDDKPGYVHPMEQIDVAVAAISGGAAIIGALIGAWWGGWLAARSAKRTQMRSIYIEEWKQISPAKLLVKKVAFFRPRDAKTMVEHMRKLADDVSMLGSRCYVKEMRDDFDLLYYLIHDMAAFVANEPMAVFKPKGDPAEDTVFVATEKEIERIEDIYRSLIETGKMPPRRGDGLYVLPTRPRVHKVRR